MGVVLTEEMKKHPLYKYYELPIDPVPADKAAEIMSMTYENPDGLPIEDINKLLDEGYMSNEYGMFSLPDGHVMFSNLTDMPGVTPEMFDWWFAWHGLDNMRYIIWDKDDHYQAISLNKEQNLDTSLSMKERYWNTTHDVKEGLFDGDEPRPVHLTFVKPEAVGFDPERLKDFKGSIVCTPGPAIMVHFVRPTATGSELRTRFWMGYQATENGVVALDGFPAIPEMGRVLLYHNAKEFAHLAKILPQLYAEYKDDFMVGIEK